jgi:hypothetical protein
MNTVTMEGVLLLRRDSAFFYMLHLESGLLNSKYPSVIMIKEGLLSMVTENTTCVKGA